MTYSPHTWTNGETITAAKLNAIENGIAGAPSVAPQTVTLGAGVKTSAGSAKTVLTRGRGDTMIAGKLYVYDASGGAGTFWAFDTVAGTWNTSLAAQPTTSNAVGAAFNGKLYACSQNAPATLNEYTPGTNTWATRANSPGTSTIIALDGQGSALYALFLDGTFYSWVSNAWTALASCLNTPASATQTDFLTTCNGKVWHTRLNSTTGNVLALEYWVSNAWVKAPTLFNFPGQQGYTLTSAGNSLLAIATTGEVFAFDTINLRWVPSNLLFNGAKKSPFFGKNGNTLYMALGQTFDTGAYVDAATANAMAWSSATAASDRLVGAAGAGCKAINLSTGDIAPVVAVANGDSYGIIGCATAATLFTLS